MPQCSSFSRFREMLVSVRFGCAASSLVAVRCTPRLIAPRTVPSFERHVSNAFIHDACPVVALCFLLKQLIPNLIILLFSFKLVFIPKPRPKTQDPTPQTKPPRTTGAKLTDSSAAYTARDAHSYGTESARHASTARPDRSRRTCSARCAPCYRRLRPLLGPALAVGNLRHHRRRRSLARTWV